MLPSWFTKLRDVKAGSNYKEQNKLLHAPSLATKRHDEDPAHFAKSWSLHRANSKAKGVRTEADITSVGDDSCPCISNGLSSLGGVGNMCNLQASELNKGATSFLMHACANLDPWDCNFISMSSCEQASMSLSGCEENKGLVQRGHGISDNDTEDFALTSETRSSFCSETSSTDSSATSCKNGCEEKGTNEGERDWREADVFIKSSGLVDTRNLEDSCALEEQTGSCHAEITAIQMSIDFQKNVQMQQDTWRGRGSFLFSYLTAGRRKSIGSHAEARNVLDGSKTGRDSRKTIEVCGLVGSCENLVKEKAGKACSTLSREEKVNSTLSSIKHYRCDGRFADKLSEKSNNAAEVKLNLVFDHGDMCGCTSNSLENSCVDPSAQDRSATMSTSAQCAPPEIAGVFSTKRRRQRGASISAVLPPDLQGVVGDSLALVKMSDNPYEDFRQSIYEMIMEKDLEESMDVEELLYCYLTLNAPEHHELIEEVFSDVWSAILMTLR